MKNLLTKKFKKVSTLALAVILLVTQTAFAQVASTTSTTLTASTDLPSTINTSSDAGVADSATSTQGSNTVTPPTSAPVQTQPLLQGSTSSVQDATTTQPAILSQVLETTANPELATSTPVTSIPLVGSTATTTSQPLNAALQTTEDENLPIDQSTTALDIVSLSVRSDSAATDTPVLVENPPVVLLKDIAPQPDFTFALTGKQIPTQRKIEDKNGEVVGQEMVTQPLASSVDNTKGEVAVSGQCTEAYFVVLLFKHMTDYADDPRSYIVNRAYPCQNGAFSYSISDLPSSLPNGNYYLLVGEEGTTGSWKPITSQTEITINKN